MTTNTLDLSDLTLEFRVVAYGLAHGLLPEGLEPGHFAGERARWLAKKILTLGSSCSKSLLLHELKRENAEDQVAAYDALFDKLSGETVSRDEADGAAVRLRELATGRRLASLLADPSGVAAALRNQQIGDAVRMLEEFLHEAASNNGRVADQGSFIADWPQLRAELERRKATEGFPGFPTYIKPWDDVFGGLYPEEFGLVAGGTGEGKSMSLSQMAGESWLRGRNVIYFSIEMPKLAIEFRLAGWACGVDTTRFRKGDTTSEDDAILEEWFTARRTMRNHLYIVDVPSNVNAAQLDTMTGAAEQRLGVRFELMFVDYLGLMTPIGRFTSRMDWDAQAEVAWNLHNLARQRHVGLWSAVQKRPPKSQRERQGSGLESIGLSYMIAQPADVVVVNTERMLEGFIESNIAKTRDAEGHVNVRLRPDFRHGRVHRGDE